MYAQFECEIEENETYDRWNFDGCDGIAAEWLWRTPVTTEHVLLILNLVFYNKFKFTSKLLIFVNGYWSLLQFHFFTWTAQNLERLRNKCHYHWKWYLSMMNVQNQDSFHSWWHSYNRGWGYRPHKPVHVEWLVLFCEHLYNYCHPCPHRSSCSRREILIYFIFI